MGSGEANAHLASVFKGSGEMSALMRSFNWQSTPLGSPENWPNSLKSIIGMMLTSRYQMWMGWGQELTFFCNDAYSPTLGVKHPWALGKAAKEVWAEIWNDIGPLIRHVLTKGEATYSEGMLLFLERSGFPEETYHTFSYSPLFDDNGSVAGMFCVVVEETDRVLNERRLGTLRELASTAAAATTENDLFAIVSRQLSDNRSDLPFTLTYLFDEERTSARLVATSGIDATHEAAREHINIQDELWPHDISDGSTVAEIREPPPHFRDLPKGAWDKPAKTLLLLPIAQSAMERPAGFFVVGANPYRPVDDNYQSFVGLLAGQIASALSAARAYEQERKRAEALAEIDRAKTTFFSNVSHEFRTPLTLMLGPLEELLSRHSTIALADAKSMIELAHRNGTRLLRLVNSLLDFSRLEAGRVQAHFVPTDIATYTSEIASTFRSAMDKANLFLEIEVFSPGQIVFVDHDMWEKIILNLLSNAFKFTFEGGVTVSIGTSQRGDRVEVQVRDTGIGVSAEEVTRLFERFHRVEGARGRTFEGSGIGLALVNELVKLHGGTIDVVSELGRGTTFTIGLRFGSAHLPKHALEQQVPDATTRNAHAFVEEALRWLPSPDSGAGTFNLTEGAIGSPNGLLPGQGKNILLADDNADVRDYVQRLLRDQGYDVLAVADGEQALRAIESRAPDLILSDVMMPNLDGFGLLRAIRSDSALASIPVILLSARAGEEAKVGGLEAGADDYLIKPFAARELLARVSANIQMAEVRRESAREVMRSEQLALISQERLSIALSTGRIAIFELDATTRLVTVFGSLVESFGVPEDVAAKGRPLEAFLSGIAESDRERVKQAITYSVEFGLPFEAEYRLADFKHHVVARGSVQMSPSGSKRLVGAVIDVSDEKIAQEALREQTRALQVLNNAGTMVAADRELKSVVQTVTDAGVELTGAEFGAFFYNVLNDAGESYMLYSLSGAPDEAFSKFPMPRNTEIFAPTFSGTGIVRSDDITKDSRYGKNSPRKGMPPGHLPVKSYLAVPVKSRTGEVLGGLFFGHSKVGVFGARAEERMTGLAAQAAIAIDNSRLFSAAQREIVQRTLAEERLQNLNTGLEERIASEVNERLRVEDALRQAQKMEAIGQLTGGVAHDFNNLLTVIMGGLDTLRRSGTGDNPRLVRALDMATQGAQRAATLTSRLLAFSRRQPLEPRPLDLNAAVRGITELLHRTLGENIDLESVLGPRLWNVEIDQSQLESAILNLAVNARDAMLDGGKLTLETSNTLLDETYTATDSEVIPGQYVVLSVSDTGSGMPNEVLGRVFEPFYTTKEVGKGTGLGLSMVYGFVKQSGGHITIYSEVGQGTTVKLYFPRFRGALTENVAFSGNVLPGGSKEEVILVVEDNDDVRKYSSMVLSELGYAVLEANDAETALSVLSGPDRVDLLFTDVVLPGMTGRALADAALRQRPKLRVLFTTGYSRNAIVHHGRLDAGVNLLTKPFTFEQLAERVRDVLDR